jgi:hypothetical protein
MNNSVSLAVILAILYVPALADISPAPGSQPVGAVFSSADLVCYCAVETLKIVRQERVGKPPKTILRQHVVASVDVDDDYKSVAPGGRRISVEFDQEIPATSASMPGLQKGERAVMFLKSAGPSDFVFADPFLAAIPFDYLPHQSDGGGLPKLEAAVVGALRRESPREQIRGVELLEGFDEVSLDTISALVPLSRSSDPDVALAAFAVLLKAKRAPYESAEALSRLKSYLDAYSGPEPPSLINIGSELGHIDSPESLSAVEALSGSKFVEIRRGAMQALRATKNPAAAATLVARLDDPDDYVRYLAVISLAETFGKYEDYAPSMYLFDRNPGFYVGIWKSWWLTEGGVREEVKQ